MTIQAKWQSDAYPKQLKTLGDHIRKRRLDLGLTYVEAARAIGTQKRAIYDWEFGRFQPTVACLPALIRFLGYDPRPEPAGLPEWLVWHRAGRGLSQAAMAGQIGVSARTLGLWETGQAKPSATNRVGLGRLRANCGIGIRQLPE